MMKPSVKKEEEKVVEDGKKSVETVLPISPKLKEPKKVSPPPPIKPSTSKAAAKKDSKPLKMGNISSFFDKASTATKTSSVQPKQEKVVEVKKESPKNESPEAMDVDEAPTRKRSASPVKSKKVTNKKPPQKKPKLKEPQNKKRSRIQVMEDSSEDEADDRKSDEERDSKIIKFDREETPETRDRSRSPTPEKQSDPVTAPAKHKAKRYVTKRYETADGFIRTEKVLEEYSAGEEDENDENRKKNSPPTKAADPVKKSPTEKKQKPTAAKPKDTVKTKQGSIMNFFNKK